MPAKKHTENFEVEINKDVLIGIAGIALEGVKGVTPVTPPVKVGEVLAGKRLKGINVNRDGSNVTVDLTVNVDYGLEIPAVAREVQRVVAENIEVMTSLNVKAVNVTIQGIVLPVDSKETANA
jgi:uncharacterized alkaline shock family protein YloU